MMAAQFLNNWLQESARKPQRSIPKRRLALESLEDRVMLASSNPHGQGLQFFPNFDPTLTVRDNSEVIIDAGRIAFLRFSSCPGLNTIDDFVKAIADIYIIPGGTTLFNGDKLTDVSGSFNTVIADSGTLFFDATLGYTQPAGKIPVPGKFEQLKYSVVIDECQDGKFNSNHDALFEDVITVRGPDFPAGPPIDKLLVDAIKADAKGSSEAQEMLLPYTDVVGRAAEPLGNLTGLVPTLLNQYMLHSKLFLGGGKHDIYVIEQLNKVRKNAQIAADPPDFSYDQLKRIAVDRVEETARDPLLEAYATVSDSLELEIELADGLLKSMEWYQGAKIDDNTESTLVHARGVKEYANRFADQLDVSTAALTSLNDTFASDSRDWNGGLEALHSIQGQVAQSGLSGDQIRELRNSGLSEFDIQDVVADFLDQDFFFDTADHVAAIAAVIAANGDYQLSLRALASGMDPIIAFIESDTSVPMRAPIAILGGPFTVNEGDMLTLDGTGSIDSDGNLVAWQWDLDLDGSFDDAFGPSPIVTLDSSHDDVIGLRVIDDSGRDSIAYTRVSIADINSPPSIDSVSPTDLFVDVPLGSLQPFSVANSDLDGDLLTVEWLLDELVVASGPTFNYQPLALSEAGVHSLRAVVADNNPLGGSAFTDWVVTVSAPDIDGDGWNANIDCDDADSAVNPAAVEIVGNGIDDDCNPQTADIGHLDLVAISIDVSGVLTDEQTLLTAGTASVTIENRGLSEFQNSLAGPFDVVLFEDRNDNASFEIGSDQLLGTQTFAGDIPSGGQVTLDIPTSGIVLFRDNVIYAMVDGADAILEADESNNVIHSGISSTYQPPVSDWQPLVEWQWDDENNSIGVRSTPVVAPLVDTNGDGLINERDVPAVIVATSGNPNANQVNELVALHGDTGEVIFQVSHPDGPGGNWSSSGRTTAVGDIDGDGAPEILIAGSFRNPLYAFNNDGTLKWQLDDRNALDAGTAGPLLADLDGDGLSEILYGKAAVNSDGTLRWVRDTSGSPLTEATSGSPQVTDLDLDGTPEIVAGPTVFDSDGQRVWSWKSVRRQDGQYSARMSVGNGPYVEQFLTDAGLGESWTAVANLDADPEPEIIAVSEGPDSMWIFEHDGQIHSGPFNLFTDVINQVSFDLGAPTVADFDGDGQVEIAVAATVNLSTPTIDDPERIIMNVYEADGSLVWQKNLVSQMTTNFAPPSSAFDFDGDGTSELVVLDAQKLYILNGADGATLFELGVDRIRDGGPDAYPAIADVDNDGAAEIIVPTKIDFAAGAPPRNGILVLGDADDNWIHSRRIWNQWQYEVTNVNEDASIPAVARNSWQENNSQRGQVPIEGLNPFAAPDLSVSRVTINAQDCPAGAGITARIGNGGSIHVASSIDVNFYLGDPNSGGTLIGTAATSQALYPGAFEDVTLDWNAPAAGQIYVSVNDTPVSSLTASANLSRLPHAWAQGSGLSPNSVVQANFRAFNGIDGGNTTTWNDNASLNYDPNHYYEVHFPFPVNATSVTIENPLANLGFLDGTLEFSNGLSVPVTLDANGEGTISFAEQADISWIRLAGTTTKADGAGLSEFIVAGSYVQPLFLLNEGAGRLGNNIAASGITVSPCEPGANLTPTVHAGLNQTIHEGDTFSLLPAAFTDGGLVGPHTAVIDWGDGAPGEAGLINESGGSGTVAGSHAFNEDGSYLISVNVTDDVGQTASDTLALTVLNVAPAVDAGPDQAADEGDTVNLAASFSDLGILDTHTATIDWGDGTVESGVVNKSGSLDNVTGSHTFGDDGMYTVTVCVTDDEGAFGCDSLQAAIANVAPMAEAGQPQTANEGDTVNLVGASFSDPGFLDAHTVLINWGDTPLTRWGTVTAGSPNAIDASYEYEDSGTFTVTVCVTDDDDAEACDTFEIVVGNIAPTVTAGFDRTVGDTISLPPAFFHDPGLADTHTATIDWGDGTVESGDIFQWRGSGSVSGSHAYAADGTYTVQISVTDDDGDSGIGTFDVASVVTNQAPTVQQDTTTTFLLGEEQTHALALSDPNPDDTHIAAITWGDGSPQETVELKNNIQGFGVGFPSHAYAIAGSFDVTACVTDDRGQTGCNTISVAVAGLNTPPSADAGGPYAGQEGADITLDASASSDPGGDLLLYQWDLDEDGQFNDASGTTPTLGWIDLVALGIGDDGTYNISVRVDDGFGGVAEATTTLTISDLSPTIALSGLASIAEGSSYALNLGVITDPGDDTVTQFIVNWGDGNSDTYASSGNVTHTYADGPAIPLIVVDLVDEDGIHTAAGGMGMTVNNVAPTADDVTHDVVENSPNGTAVGSVTASDPGADTLTYSILGGTGSTAFAIDSSTGTITVADVAQLDFETTPSFTLEVTVTDDDDATGVANVTINLLNQASISGTVFVDADLDGLFDANEIGVDGVIVELLDAAGNALDNRTTGDGGFYLFEDLDPLTYQIHELQPTGFNDGLEQLGSLGGSIVANDTMQLTLQRSDAFDYIFAEFGQALTSGDTATIGFWQNKHGQELIAQGGVALAQWLTINFGNVFGNEFVGASGQDVANFYKRQLFKQKGKNSAGPAKVDAQYMAVAIATFFTTRDLAGDVAAGFGFNVTASGIGTRLVNVGTKGAAFGVADFMDLTIMQLLRTTDSLTDQLGDTSGFAAIYDTNGDGIIDAHEAALRSMANEIYTAVNEEGDN